MMRSKPVGMNLELTNVCPYRCPQCYVPFGGEDLFLSKEEALYWIADADRNGIQYVNMSGGETLCYPYLEELIKECAARGMKASVSISGAYADTKKLRRLMAAGLSSVCVSLNGSTREINGKTRQGYEEAVAALSSLREIAGNGTQGAKVECVTAVNFVMHGNNAGDLGNMLRLLEKYQVDVLVILAAMPSAAMPSADKLPADRPSEEQIREAARVLKAYNGPVKWLVNRCFFELRSLLKDYHELDAEGDETGCGAGYTHITVTPDGSLSPCNHLDLPEKYGSIREYLALSKTLRRLRREVSNDSEIRPCCGISKCLC